MSYKNTYLDFYSSNNNNNNNLLGNMNFGLSDYNQVNNQSLLGANISLADGLTFNKDNSSISGLSGLSNGSTGNTGSSFLTSMIGNENTSGWGGTALNLLKSGLGFYLGQQQLRQAENTLNENKRQFDLNYNAQKNLINDQLAWQYQARKDRNSSYDGTLTQIA